MIDTRCTMPRPCSAGSIWHVMSHGAWNFQIWVKNITTYIIRSWLERIPFLQARLYVIIEDRDRNSVFKSPQKTLQSKGFLKDMPMLKYIHHWLTTFTDWVIDELADNISQALQHVLQHLFHDFHGYIPSRLLQWFHFHYLFWGLYFIFIRLLSMICAGTLYHVKLHEVISI